MRWRPPGSGGDEAVPRPARDGQVGRHVILALVVLRHAAGGRPREVVVQGLAQRVVRDADIRERFVEAGDGAAVHLRVDAVATVHADDRRLGAVVLGRAAEGHRPVRGEAVRVVRVEAAVERVGDHRIGEHAHVPGVGERAEAVAATRRLEDRLHPLGPALAAEVGESRDMVEKDPMEIERERELRAAQPDAGYVSSLEDPDAAEEDDLLDDNIDDEREAR